MARKNEPTKLVTIESTGSLPELGGISGPVINPTLLPLSVLVMLINGHKKIYEVNPANPDEKVRLSLKNVRKENFAPVVKNVAPSVVKKDAAKKENVPTTSKTTATETAKVEKTIKENNIPADGDFKKN